MPRNDRADRTDRLGARGQGANTDKRRLPALIWISGTSEDEIDQSLEGIATRIAIALDRQTKVPRVNFLVDGAVQQEQIAGGFSVPTCKILRSDPAATEPVIELFGFATQKKLLGDTPTKSVTRRLLLGAFVVLRCARKLIAAIRKKRGKTPVERRQLFYASLWMTVLVAGLVIMLATLAATVSSTAMAPSWLKFAQAAAITVGGLSIWKSRVAQRLSATALIGYAFVDYLDHTDDAGAELHGQLVELLDVLVDRAGPPPRDIELLAYSFGSLVAVDTLFPMSAPPPQRLTDVNRLVTIGCPFDFVRTYWPSYFKGRFSLLGAPGDWINVHAPSDVLSSNFNDDTGRFAEATATVEVRDGQPEPVRPHNIEYPIDGRESPVSGFDALSVRGFQFHGQYWSPRPVFEESVFDVVVHQLHAGQFALGWRAGDTGRSSSSSSEKGGAIPVR